LEGRRANAKRCADITWVWTDETWLELALVIDLRSCRTVGFSMNVRMTRQREINALRLIWFRV
jgi:putative transposase